MAILQTGFIASGRVDPANSAEITSPTPLALPHADLVKAYPGGWGFGLASNAGGSLFVWGVNAATLLDKQGSAEDGADPSALDQVLGDGVTTAAAGFDHVLVATGEETHVFGPSYTPQGVRGLHLASIHTPHPVAALAAGEHHSLILTRAGSLYTFGLNREGQLGTGRTDARGPEAPALVLGPGSSRPEPITAVAAGARHSLAVTRQGQVLGWGWSLHGQAGTGEATPAVNSPHLVVALGPLVVDSVAGGQAHSLALTQDGDVYAWGLNGDGQLGDGTTQTSLQPKLLEAVTVPVASISAGARHSLLLTRTGCALAAGHGAFGATGTGRYEDSLAPTAVASPAGRRVTALAAGWWHSLFVLA
ncbi:hypothetical protein ACKKBG_A25915 [Auxenochlorella protothecoides x Auxenochlorella symbiontica]